MLSRLRDRFGARAIVIGSVVMLLGGGVAAAATDTLPEPAQQALASAAERITDIYGGSDDTGDVTVTDEGDITLAEAESTEIETSDAEGDIGHPMDNGEGVPQEVKDYFASLMVWIECIQEGASDHAAQQSNPDTRVEDDEYTDEKKEELCGPKPINLNDSEEEIEEEEEIEDIDGEGSDGEGMPEEVQTFLAELHTWIACVQDGARAHGEQQSTFETRIEDDEYTDAEKVTLCGEKPTNPNDTEGEIEGEGRPDDAGPPPWAGRPDDAEPASGAGRP